MSLDGGGICGIYGASLLARIEAEITGGKPIAEYFDTIAGTSTGGILALALGLGISAKQIENLYKTDGKEIFKQKWFWKLIPCSKIVSQLRRSLYNHEVLEKALRREFGHRTVGESIARLVIPAFMAPKAEIAVFKTDHHPDIQNDWRTEAWVVARATSAAPTYFRGHEHEDVIFLDGGIWANNPVMVAMVDALSAYDISVEQIEILSIGTGNIPFEITIREAKRGLWSWKKVIKAAMFLTTDNAHAQAGLLLGPEKITRLEPVAEAATIELDDWPAAVSILPSMAAQHFIEAKDDISKFFAAKVNPRHRFYT